MTRRDRRADAQIGPNEALRFFLELAALAAIAYWGWTTFDGLTALVAAIGVPLAAAAVWGVFRVPDDPGPAPVAVPGAARLIIEVIFFAAAVVLLFAAGQEAFAVALAGAVVLHYALGYRRVAWLLGRDGRYE